MAGGPNAGPAHWRRPDARSQLGGAALLTVVASIGLALIAAANTNARLGEPGGEELFWAGLLLIYLPISLRLFGSSAQRQERLALAAILGLALYFVKVLHSPSEFTFHDELASWRGVWDFLRTGHLFTENPLVNGYSVFPGLTTTTAALGRLSGLSTFLSALILIGVARVTLMVALFLIIERASASARTAGIVIVVYACNPSMLYFDSQFGYESLALPLAAAFLLVVMRGAGFDPRPDKPSRPAMLSALLLLGAGLVITHHFTSYAMFAFLALWTAINVLLEGVPVSTQLRDPLAPGPSSTVLTSWMDRIRVGPAIGCVVLGALAAAWFLFVAGGATQDELGGVFSKALSALVDLITGSGGGKTLFKAGTGHVDPIVTRALGLGSVGVLAAVIPLGAWRVWHSRRGNSIAVSLAIIALLYPVTLVPRLTQAGSEISQRASEFVFVGIGFVAAVLYLHLTATASRTRRAAFALLATTLASLVFVGGVILGESPDTRQPGPFEVGAEARSIGPQGVSAAEFAARHLPRDSRILVDSPNGLLLGSYGHLDPVLGDIRGIPITEVFFSPTLNRRVRTVIVHDAIDYVVVDRRLSRSLPIDGHYYERGEPQSFERNEPIERTRLTKFSKVKGTAKIYENGPIAIFDMHGIGAP